MKYFISVMIFILGNVSFGNSEDIPLPSGLEGGKVTITLKDGHSYEVKSEEYAVVKRKQNGVKTVFVYNPNKEARRNTVKVFGGVGSTGLKATSSGSSVSVEQTYGLNTGFGYERELSDELSLDVLAVGNQYGITGGLLGVGFKF